MLYRKTLAKVVMFTFLDKNVVRVHTMILNLIRLKKAQKYILSCQSILFYVQTTETKTNSSRTLLSS